MLIYLLVATPACLLVFLGFSNFFASWSGQAVSVRPTASEAPAVYRVLIVDSDGTRHERDWSPEAVSGLSLPIDPLALPPKNIPEDRPKTRKTRYSMSYQVERVADGLPVWREYPTTSPQALGIAFVLWLLGFAGRNMWVSGSPFALEERAREKITDGGGQWGQPVAQQGRTGGRKKPPDQGRSKKRRSRPR